jgi:DNA-binding CsgD family transcriptional regulator
MNLTAREEQVCRRLVLGETDLEIADALGLSPHTVDGHMRMVFAKLGVANRVRAAVIFDRLHPCKPVLQVRLMHPPDP